MRSLKENAIVRLIEVLNYDRDVCQSLLLVELKDNRAIVEYTHRFQHEENPEHNFRQLTHNNFNKVTSTYLSTISPPIEEIAFNFASMNEQAIKNIIDFYTRKAVLELDETNKHLDWVNNRHRDFIELPNGPIDKKLDALRIKAVTTKDKHKYLQYTQEIAKLLRRKLK